MKIKKILIIGFGGIGSKHYQILKKLLPYSKIKILHHNDKINKLNTKIEKVNNIDEALSFLPDLVVISNPTSFHIKSAIPFAKIKANIFIEKPISNQLRGVSKLINIYEKNNLFISVGYNLRYLNSLIFLKKIINKKNIGKIFHFYSTVGSYLPYWRKKNYAKSVSSSKQLGGGALLELSHEIDYISWIFGNIENVTAKVLKQSKLKIDVEDTCSIILSVKSKFNEKNLLGTLIIDFIRKDANRDCIIIGEKGTLKWNGINGTVDYFNTKQNKWKRLYSNKKDLEKSYINQWKDIINRINNNRKPLINIFDGINTLQIIESIKISNKKGKTIKIKD